MKRANLWLSLISFCLLALEPSSATYTRSDNDSGSSGPSVALTRQAMTLGMEPAALGELWRTKQPVLVSKTDEQGQLYTTTYELSPDGQHIRSRKVKEEPQPSSTTTTTPSSPAAAAPAAAPAASMPQPTNPQTDWEYVPSNMGNRRTFTLPSNWPDFGSRLPQFPSFDFPPGITPQTSTKTSQDDQGRTVTTTTKTYKGPIGSSWPTTGTSLGANWPSFEFPAGVTPQTTSKTEQDDQGRTVTTLTRTYKSPVFTTWSTGAEPTFSQGLPPWFKNTNPFADEVPSLTPSSAQPYPVQPAVSSPPLPTPPPAGTPRTELGELPPATRRVTSYSSSFNGAATPKTADLDPQLRYLLDRGGFTDEDIQNAQALGRDLVRTRVLPDGRTIRTTLRIIKSPVRAPPAYTPLPTAPVSHTQPEVPPLCQAQPGSQILPGDNPIDNFLSQVQLTSDDIQAQNGELVKTIVDQYGRVLSAKFVLSTVKGEGQGQGQQEQPTK